MAERQAITDGLRLVFDGIAKLKSAFSNRAFTIDGRLVGDIGEVIAALEYDVILFETSQPDHDGVTSDGRRVQIKATFKESLTCTAVPDYYLGFRLCPDGSYEEIYNGPGTVIRECYGHRKGFGVQQLSFPIRKLRELSRGVLPHERIPRRPDVPPKP